MLFVKINVTQLINLEPNKMWEVFGFTESEILKQYFANLSFDKCKQSQPK